MMVGDAYDDDASNRSPSAGDSVIMTIDAICWCCHTSPVHEGELLGADKVLVRPVKCRAAIDCLHFGTRAPEKYTERVWFASSPYWRPVVQIVATAEKDAFQTTILKPE